MARGQRRGRTNWGKQCTPGEVIRREGRGGENVAMMVWEGRVKGETRRNERGGKSKAGGEEVGGGESIADQGW